MMALPALIDDDGTVLFESLAIIEYLDEAHPESAAVAEGAESARAGARPRAARCRRFTPADRAARARVSSREFYSVDEAGVIAWGQHWHNAGAERRWRRTSRQPKRKPALLPGRADHRRRHLPGEPDRRAANFYNVDWRRIPDRQAHQRRLAKLDAFARAHPLKQPGAPASSVGGNRNAQYRNCRPWLVGQDPGQGRQRLRRADPLRARRLRSNRRRCTTSPPNRRSPSVPRSKTCWPIPPCRR